MSFDAFCETCPFFSPRKEHELGKGTRYWHDGECRKNAPYGQGNVFLPVDKTDWCGDHPDNSLPAGMVWLEPEDPDACVKPEWRKSHAFR